MNSSPVPPPEPPIGYIQSKSLPFNLRNNSGPKPVHNSINDVRSIRPTTAGLLQYPTPAHLIDFQQNQPNHFEPQSNKSFKDELMFKQNQMEEGFKQKQQQTSTALSGQSIDDRIKLRKMKKMERNNETQQRRQQQQQQNLNVPNKLISTTSMQQQRDKRPFAYSPDVNDPNNRGKLDLSQIKSPIMRRRLLANMESKSDSEGEKDSGDDGDEIYVEDKLKDQTNTSEQQVIEIKKCKPIIAPKPKHFLHASGEEAVRVSSALKQTQPKPSAHAKTSPIVHFKEPPKIYTTETIENITTNEHLKPTIITNQLDADIAQSLNSLTMLADGLDRKYRQYQSTILEPQSRDFCPNSDNANYDHNQAEQLQLTSFQPVKPVSVGNNWQQQQHELRQNKRPNNFYQTLPSGRRRRQLLDTHESGGGGGGDANVLYSNLNNACFSVASNRGPYSISPYYGCSLNIDEMNDFSAGAIKYSPQTATMTRATVAAAPQLKSYSHNNNNNSSSSSSSTTSRLPSSALLGRNYNTCATSKAHESNGVTNGRKQLSQQQSTFLTNSWSDDSVQSQQLQQQQQHYGVPTSAVPFAREQQQQQPHWREKRAQHLRDMTVQLQREVDRLNCVDLSRF